MKKNKKSKNKCGYIYCLYWTDKSDGICKNCGINLKSNEY
jgi:hypothetical protein